MADEIRNLSNIFFPNDFKPTLSAVFDVLSEPDKTIVDDTTLDKLYFTVQAFCTQENNQAWFIECDNVIKFIEHAPLHHRDPKISSFALKLLSYIGTTPAGLDSLRGNNLFHILELVYQDSAVWEAATVRNSWFLTMTALIKQPEIQTIVSSIDNGDKFIKNHFEDESIFVSKSCHQFLISYVIEIYSDRKSLQFCRRIIDWLVTKFHDFKQTPIEGFTRINCFRSLIYVLFEICKGNSAIKHEISSKISIDDISTIVVSLKERLLIDMMDYIVDFICCLHCYSKTHGVSSQFIKDELIGLIDRLLKQGSKTVAVDLATRLFIRCDEELEELKVCITEPIKETIFNGKMTRIRATSTSLSKISFIKQQKGVNLLSIEEICDFLRILTSSNPTAHMLKLSLHCLQDSLRNAKEMNGTNENCLCLLIELLKDLSLDQVVVDKVYNSMELCITNLLESDIRNMDFIPDLTRVVLCGFCSMNWEIRDSTVEFIGHLCKISAGEETWLSKWLQENDFEQQVIKSLQDTESYVRVAAVNALSNTVVFSNLLQDEILEKVLKMATEDESNLVRRSLISYLNKLYIDRSIDNENLIESLICPLMKKVVQDSDWEVKIFALIFWEEWLQRNIDQKNKETSEMLESFVKSGLCESLMKTISDCEPLVCEKSCQILIRMKLFLSDLINSAETGILDTDVSFDKIDSSMFVKWLNEVNLEENLKQSQKSSDEYIRNPKCLLEDILAVTKTSDDNLLDCY